MVFGRFKNSYSTEQKQNLSGLRLTIDIDFILTKIIILADTHIYITAQRSHFYALNSFRSRNQIGLPCYETNDYDRLQFNDSIL